MSCKQLKETCGLVVRNVSQLREMNKKPEIKNLQSWSKPNTSEDTELMSYNKEK